MKREVRVAVKWLLRDPAGQVPVWKRYWRPVRFPGESLSEDWFSLIVDLDGSPDPEGNQIGVARFFVDEAPQEKLSLGQRFTLYEGHQPTMEGVVTEILRT